MTTTTFAPTVADDDQHDRRLLALAPQREQSTLANRFYHQLRSGPPPADLAPGGIWTPEALRVAVMVELTGRLRHAAANGYRDTHDRLGEQIALLNRNVDAARDFARYAIKREALPPAERERMKRAASEGYVRAHMDKEPATEKQVAYLRRMGYDGPIDSKAHASSLIDIYTRGGRVELAS